MADSVKVQHIPFYFPDQNDFISYISGTNNDAPPNIVLGGGIQNLITFYQMAKAGLIKDSLDEAFAGKKTIKEDTVIVTEYVGGKESDNQIFSPYKVTFGGQEVTKQSFNLAKYEEIGFVEVKPIHGNIYFGGNNTTRKGGRRRRKARGRKTPKRRVKKSKK